MERLPLYCNGAQRGEVTMALWGMNGTRVEIHASMGDPGDGLYRAFLIGERGELPMGVMAPEGGRMCVCRRVYHKDLDALGTLVRGEARRSFLFENPGNGWRETCCPAQLFQDKFWIERLRPFGRGLWRREGDALLLDLPLAKGKPFPLDFLFCLGRVECVEGVRCVVYWFREGEPVLGVDG